MTVSLMQSLGEWETACRERVGFEPDDLSRRADLAWCLLLQALYRAGQEDSHEFSNPGVPEPGCRTSDALLVDCLRQAVVVRRCGPEAQSRTDVDRLKSLVKVFREEAVSHEEARVLRVIAGLRADMDSPPAPDGYASTGGHFRLDRLSLAGLGGA